MKNNTEKTKFLNDLTLLKKKGLQKFQKEKKLFSTNNHDYKALESPTTLEERAALLLTFCSSAELRNELLAHNKFTRVTDTKLSLINALSTILAVKQECKNIDYKNFVFKNLDLLENSSGDLNVTLLFWNDLDELWILLARPEIKTQLRKYKMDFLGHLYLPRGLVIYLISFTRNTVLYYLLMKVYFFKEMRK